MEADRDRERLASRKRPPAPPRSSSKGLERSPRDELLRRWRLAAIEREVRLPAENSPCGDRVASRPPRVNRASSGSEDLDGLPARLHTVRRVSCQEPCSPSERRGWRR